MSRHFPIVFPLFLAGLLLFGPGPESLVGQDSFRSLRCGLPEVLVADKIRVFYAVEGPHALGGPDANDNGRPDRAEDVLTQTLAARLLWSGLGFPDPLETERYRGTAWIDVHLVAKEAIGSNGVAYDEIQRFGRGSDPAGTGSLCFDVATSVDASANLTPAHEYFHLLQNSLTYFKNRWFTEGTARWSERGLGKGGLTPGLRAPRWPPDEIALKKVFGAAYGAAADYWEPLLERLDGAGTMPEPMLPAALKEARYVGGGAVLEDRELTGWRFVRELLLALGEDDRRVREERDLDRWPEAEQKSPANDRVIHARVLELARARGLASRPTARTGSNP